MSFFESNLAAVTVTLLAQQSTERGFRLYECVGGDDFLDS